MENKNQNIPYKIRISRRAKNIRLSVACDSSVTLTLPVFTVLGAAEKFVQEKMAWIKKTLEYFRVHPVTLRLKTPRGEYKKTKATALLLAQNKVKQWSEFYGVSYNRVSVKNQKTRWGSCSRKGNLNFNYRIIRLRPELLDYLVVHELRHIKEFNHSKKFWGEVAKAVPNYKSLRKELKTFAH